MPTQPSKNLDTFPNPHPDRDYIIEIECPEFTCLCPKTGQPDFASLTLEYAPDRLCVELKSLKLYIWSYRNEGHFHEDVTNRILNDLVAVIHPRYLRLRAKFNVRGGLYTTIEVVHRQSGWDAPPPPPADLPREVQELPAREPPAAASAKTAAAKSVPASKPRNPVRLTEPVTPTPPVTTRNPAPAPAPEATVAPAAPASDRFRMLRRTRRQEPAPTSTAVDEPEEQPAIVRKEGLYIGIDLGTTGCRAIAVDAAGKIQGEMSAPIPTPPRNEDEVTQDPTVWWKAVTGCLQNLLQQIDPQRVQALAVDGTSGTLLLCDAKGNPVTPAIMYNDRRAMEQAKKIASLASNDSGAQGASSSLAKLLWLHERKLDKRAQFALHQADWISGRLTGQFGHSDYNNCLKLGYDAEKMTWPKWLSKLGFNVALLPEVHAPGETLGTISADTAKTFGLPSDVQILAGTTDGVAAFLAAGATEPGHGVTALGTTLVLKLLSEKPVFSLEHGVYSHRLGKYWLAGGASNSGGAVLLQYFKVEQMREMTPLLDPENFTGLDYYPLPDIGERFPINSPEMTPRLEPLPGNSVTFFQGMLEGIARIEAQGYELLEKHGAPALNKIYTTGGGSQNPAWGRIREKILRVKLEKPRSGHAAYGSALLAAGIVTKTFS
ncbi:MAG: NADPH-dependent 7-cyano-7-deazaguanine reductase QueF [Gammaproteobacteria bacterium]|nr:NADPH-dependent 7-cyano-7-deazaguanine reductase QueF [Gammaproteobacteria bacterium]